MEEKDGEPKEISGVKKKTKTKLALDRGVLYKKHFSEDDFESEYEEECPVNYSLKYSETESCKANKNEDSTKAKFVRFADAVYSESDLYRPRDFTLKYSEKPSGKEGMENAQFAYYESDKGKYKEYADYAETDLDQPTDFALKYRESTEEEAKPPPQTFSDHFQNEKSKSSDHYEGRTEPEEVTSLERASGQYPCEDQTPLMFSRSSSLNSLSSFEQLAQSVPDDGSSVVSDISHTASGIVSPSELPDSPTQTAPSSPKSVLKPVSYSVEEELREKKSVFEDDVATFKQEDTPIEFSRATSLSSLNIESTAKAESNLKTNSKASSVAGGDDGKGKEISPDSAPNDPSYFGGESRSAYGKTESKNRSGEADATAKELDDILARAFNNIRIEKSGEDRRRLIKSAAHQMPPTAPERNRPILPNAQFPIRSTCFPRYESSHLHSCPSSRYETSDDDVITYHTEGTPANISHAGSHSDLSSISIPSDTAPPAAAAENNFDGNSFCTKNHGISSPSEEKVEEYEIENSVKISDQNRLLANINENATKENEETYFRNQSQLDYFKNENSHSPPFKDDEGSASSASHRPFDCGLHADYLTLHPPRTSVCINRFAEFRGQMARQTTTVSNSQRFSSPSIAAIGQYGGGRKGVFEAGDQGFPIRHPSLKPKCCNKKETNSAKLLSGFCEPSPAAKSIKNLREQLLNRTRSDLDGSLSVENWNGDSCTYFEEVLVEQCISLGMPGKSGPKKPEENGFKSLDGRAVENWHSKSCTPLEEALVEQCIRLGMPQKSKRIERSNSLNLNERKVLREREQQLGFISSKPIINHKPLYHEPKSTHSNHRNYSCETHHFPPFTPGGTEISVRNQSPTSLNADHWCTGFEEALVEQCIRMGMPGKNNVKNEKMVGSQPKPPGWWLRLCQRRSGQSHLGFGERKASSGQKGSGERFRREKFGQEEKFEREL